MEVEHKLRNRLEQFGKLMQLCRNWLRILMLFSGEILLHTEINILHILQMSESQIVHGIYKEIKLLKWERSRHCRCCCEMLQASLIPVATFYFGVEFDKECVKD
jgi:hypothetical protein